MKSIHALLLSLLITGSWAPVPAAPPDYLTFDNTPMGSEKRPLILRTYMPDPGLEDAVFANHGKAANSPRYNVGEGRDVGGEYKPVKGIPAAIGVNHGAALSYCFDTTECRIMYAWQGGFLDMFPYWGDKGRGNRQSFNYVPHLIGNLFYRTSGTHPLHIDGTCISGIGAPDFLGYEIRDKFPVFRYRVADHTIEALFAPGKASPNSFTAKFKVTPAAKLSFKANRARVTESSPRPGFLRVVVKHDPIANYQGFPRDMGIKQADADSGRKLYLNYGCIACHSTDGSRGHGPTFGGLAGKTRPLEGGGEVLADKAYLLESIRNPNARVAKGFPPSYMPPYQLKDIEYEALATFIISLAQSK